MSGRLQNLEPAALKGQVRPQVRSQVRPQVQPQDETAHAQPGTSIMKRLFPTLLFTCLWGLPAQAAEPPFVWPQGAKAAVGLACDDALDSQPDTAIPALDAAGLKGQFLPHAEQRYAEATVAGLAGRCGERPRTGQPHAVPSVLSFRPPTAPG